MASGWVTFVLIALSTFACGQPRPSSTPDAAPDAPAPFCGDGVLLNGEQCDQGPITGTPQSTCTKQCRSIASCMYAGAIAMHRIAGNMPNPARQLVDWQLNNGYTEAVAFTGSGDEPLHVGVPYTQAFSETEAPRYIPLQLHAPASSVTRLWTPSADPNYAYDVTYPLWVERAIPNVGGPWLVYATFDASLTPTYTEIPYPFPDGEGGQLHIEPGQMPLLVDYSAVTHELLIAVIVADRAGSIRVLRSRLPAPGTHRGVLAAVPVKMGGFSSPVTGDYVQFFDDNETFQLFRIDSPTGDPLDPTAQYAAFEVAHGSWPMHVTDATYWLEGWDALDPPTHNPAYLNPYPTALVTDTGDVYIWQFDHAPSGELPVIPYGHVPPGSHVPSWPGYPGCIPRALTLYSPDGNQIYLHDSDDNDVASSALLPEVAPAFSPWTSMAFSQPVLNGPNGFLQNFSVDTTLYFHAF